MIVTDPWPYATAPRHRAESTDGDLSIWEQVAVEARPTPGWED